MGESFGPYKTGAGEEIFPYITSSNIACGFHGGDPVHIEKTISLALQYGVQIGAHPSYPDRAGFGRRYMAIKKSEMKSILKYQIAVLKALVESQGGRLLYVKPHGALYNRAARDEREARAVIGAVRDIDDFLWLMGLAGGIGKNLCKRESLGFIAEAFADRRYEKDGRLMSRAKPGAVIHDPEEAAAQALSIVKDHCVFAPDGTPVPVRADSICIHGDNPAVIPVLKKINERFSENGIEIKGFDK